MHDESREHACRHDDPDALCHYGQRIFKAMDADEDSRLTLFLGGKISPDSIAPTR